MRKIVVLLISTSYLLSCSGGLDPVAVPKAATLSGVVHYIRGGGASNFPPQDSLFDLRVIAFKEIPRDTNIILAILNGDAFYSISLFDSLYAANQRYSLEVAPNQVADSAITLRYIVVGQRYGANALADWRVVGIYSTTGDFTPASISVVQGETRKDLDINVDFGNIPPQPFKR